MKQIINVTQDDIDNGKMHDNYCCPIALALNRQIGGEWNVGQFRLINNEDTIKYVSIIPSESVCRFITAFDYRDSVEPFAFEIELPATHVA